MEYELRCSIWLTYSEWEISFFTGIPGYVVKEYIEIIEDQGTGGD